MPLSAACQTSLGAGYASVLGNCARTCMLLATSQPLNDGSALRASTLGGMCLSCEKILGSCGESLGATQDTDWVANTPAFRSKAFKCGGQWAFNNATRTVSVGLRNICYPSSCSLDDVTHVFRLADTWSTNSTAFDGGTGAPTCDIFGSFLDETMPWFVCGGAVALFVVILFLTGKGCLHGRVLRCILYAILSLDFAVGVGFIVGYVLIQSKTDFPRYLQLCTVGVGVFQVLIAFILWAGGRRNGTSCMLVFAQIFAVAAAVVSAGAGLVFTIAGPDMLRDGLRKMIDISNAELDEIEDFMTTTHVLLSCAFFLLAGLHSSTVPVSRGMRRYAKDESRQEGEKAQMVALSGEQKYEREKQSFIGAHRAKVEKQDKGKAQEWV